MKESVLGGAVPPDPPGKPSRQLVVWRHDHVRVQRDVPGLGDLRDDTEHGRLLGKSYLRAQLGLSLLCLIIALMVTASFPVLAALDPAVGRASVAGMPVTLIVLGFAFYPVLLGIGWFYNHQARHLETRFTELVAPQDRDRDRPPDA